MYKVLERIILDRFIKHREEITRDEQAGFRPGRSTIDQVFIVRRVIEIRQRYSKPMQLDFEAAFDSPHRGRLLNTLRADGVPGKFVRLLDDMNQRTAAAVRTPAGCTTSFEVVSGVRQGEVAGPFLFNFAIDDIMRRTVDQCPADIVLAPSGCPLTELEYVDDVVIFAESSTKLQHVVSIISKVAAAYGLRLYPDKCKQIWISSRPRTGIRVDGQPIELVDEFCYLGCTLKNNGSYERDVQQRCDKAASASNSSTKCLWSTPITNEVKLRVYLSAIRPIMMYGSETWAAPSTVMEKLDCTERKLLRRLLGYFWPRGPADRLVQRVLRSSSGSSWKNPPDRKRKFWTEAVKEDLRTLGVDRQFRRDYSHMIMQFGQFLSHDITHAPLDQGPNAEALNCSSCDSFRTVSTSCMPIPVPEDDPFFSPIIEDEPQCIPFVRSLNGQRQLGPRTQINQLTAYIDGSVIYGSTICEANALRAGHGGKLKTSHSSEKSGSLLPQAEDRSQCQSYPRYPCFMSGDERVSQHPGITTLHILFHREHNRLASKLSSINPHWDDEMLYQETRRIVGAEIAHITFNEFLPKVLGNEVVDKYDLRPKPNGYFTGYDEHCEATLSHSFSTSAYRFGHSLARRTSPKQYSSKMKGCSPVLNTVNGVAVGEATLPIWREHFKTLLNRLAPSAPELEHVHRLTYVVNEAPPTESEVPVYPISAEILKYLPPSGIRGMTKIIPSIWIDERTPDSWRHAIITPLHKKLSVTDPRNYRGISLLRGMYKVLERIILDRFIKHREEITRDEQAGFRPGRSTIDQVFIVRRVIEIWQRYSNPMQLDFEAAFDSPHRGRLLNTLRADGVPGKFVRLLDDMNQRTTAAVRTPSGCTTPFEVVIGIRQGTLAGPFVFNFAIDDVMRGTVDQCPADIVLAPSGCPLTELEYVDDVVIFAESSTKLQHVVSIISKVAAAYGLRLYPDKCKQIWISSRPRTGIRVDGQPIELVDEFCYLGCTLKNNGSYERDVQQRCDKAASASNSLTKCLWSTPITNEVKLRVYLSAIRPIMMYGSETWAAPSTVMEKLDCTERKLLRRLLGYFWPRETGRSPCSTNSEEFAGFELEEATWPKAKVLDEVIQCKLLLKIEKVEQSCVQGRHTSAKMRVIASGDDISPPIKSHKFFSRPDAYFHNYTSPLDLAQNFEYADAIYDMKNGGAGSILLGLVSSSAMAADRHLNDALRNYLFSIRGKPQSGHDLAAINIMRGRDHGVPPYVAHRKLCGLATPVSFADLSGEMSTSAVEALSSVYESVEDIDLFTGIISETPMKGAMVGPTAACIIADQFSRIKKCDRFHYENDGSQKFSQDQLDQIRQITLSSVICANHGWIRKLQPDAFSIPDDIVNAPTNCGYVPKLDLAKWIDLDGCPISNSLSLSHGESTLISPCTGCTCTQEGLRCKATVVHDCYAVAEKYSVAEMKQDPACIIQCSSIFKKKYV
ncbi:hypothetical protein RB195_019360 [Necator americanus]|uniref:Reverse transcriptase domain-containing protein n=1 Tax=Necator americanus TaxID=51031 RepID=A0ABR1CHC7_NECAM